jgi:hypothetical protein
LNGSLTNLPPDQTPLVVCDRALCGDGLIPDRFKDRTKPEPKSSSGSLGWLARVRENECLSAALSCITAAVVGVILSLAVWFGVQVLFSEVSTWSGWGLRVLTPDIASAEPAAFVITAFAALALFRFHLNVIAALVACAVLGVAWSAF